MSNEQNFSGQATSDYFDLTTIQSALDTQEEHLNDNTGSGLFVPNFVYGYGPQESAYTSGGGLLDNDAGHSYSAQLATGSGNSNYSQPNLISDEQWVDDAVEILRNMSRFFRENLCAIEELLRKRDGMQRGRAAGFGSRPAADCTTIVPVPLPFHTITSSDVDPNGPLEHLPHYDTRPGSFSVTRAGPWHTDLPITARASSVPADVCMDSENTTQSTSFTVVDGPSARYFLCKCGHQTKTKGDMLRHHETLKHAERKYACPCGVSYTRGDGLKRHQRSCKRKRYM